MKAFDARCHDCGGVHIVWVSWDHEVGDEVRIAHRTGGRDCDRYGPHTLERRLDGMEGHERWGPESP